jgi:hypothetical protein
MLSTAKSAVKPTSVRATGGAMQVSLPVMPVVAEQGGSLFLNAPQPGLGASGASSTPSLMLASWPANSMKTMPANGRASRNMRPRMAPVTTLVSLHAPSGLVSTSNLVSWNKNGATSADWRVTAPAMARRAVESAPAAGKGSDAVFLTEVPPYMESQPKNVQDTILGLQSAYGSDPQAEDEETDDSGSSDTI